MNDAERRDLVERNAQIQEMTKHPGWAMLEDYLRAQMTAKQRAVLLGNMRTIEDYRQMTGWLQGVADALSAPQQLELQVERAHAPS